MKLTPPSLMIPTRAPYQDDLFGRKEFGDSLTALFTSIDEGIVLCVDAPWGDGKSTFAQMWAADLRLQGKHVISFDAFEHDFTEDPFVAFCAEIIQLAEEEFEGKESIQELKEEFKTKALRIGSKVLTTGIRLGTKLATLGILKDEDLKAVEGIKDDIASSSSNALSSLVEQALESYIQGKGQVNKFRDQLSRLAGAVRLEQDFPLLIIVDELDRCRPDFAIALIERVKHLFTTQNVSFVLMANVRQLENSAKAIYGAEIDARNYLQKFFTLTVDLPKHVFEDDRNDYLDYCEVLLDHFGINELDHHVRDDLKNELAFLFDHCNFSLREMERCISYVAIYFSQKPSRALRTTTLLAMLVVCRVRFPDVFNDLAKGRLSFEQLSQRLNWPAHAANASDQIALGRLHQTFRVLMMQQDDFESLNGNDPLRHIAGALTPRRSKRSEVIPQMCTALRRFEFARPVDEA